MKFLIILSVKRILILCCSKTKPSCCSSLQSWPSVCDWCFYWCPTDSGVMCLLPRSQRSIILPPLNSASAWQQSSHCFSLKHIQTESLLVPLPRSERKINFSFQKAFKKCAQEISHVHQSPHLPLFPPRNNLNLFHLIFKHSHDPFAQVEIICMSGNVQLFMVQGRIQEEYVAVIDLSGWDRSATAKGERGLLYVVQFNLLFKGDISILQVYQDSADC